MDNIGAAQRANPELININELTVCQTLCLLIRKIKEVVVQCFSLCCIAIQNHTPILREHLIQQRLAKQQADHLLLETLSSRIRFAIKEANLQERIALKARFHLILVGGPCRYPRRIDRRTQHIMIDPDFRRLMFQSRQALFDELPVASQLFLNAIRDADKDRILNEVLDSELNEFDNSVHVMENDLFQFFNQPDLLDSLSFETSEVDESIKRILRQRLTEPLSERLNSFSPPMQDNLLNSAYCQLKKAKTGTGDEIVY